MNQGQFKKGLPRPVGAGRKRGSLNRKSEALIEKCERQGIDPFNALLELAASDDQNIKLSALKEICSYLYPKRLALDQSVEVSGPDGRPIEMKAVYDELSDVELGQLAVQAGKVLSGS